MADQRYVYIDVVDTALLVWISSREHSTIGKFRRDVHTAETINTVCISAASLTMRPSGATTVAPEGTLSRCMQISTRADSA